MIHLPLVLEGKNASFLDCYFVPFDVNKTDFVYKKILTKIFQYLLAHLTISMFGYQNKSYVKVRISIMSKNPIP